MLNPYEANNSIPGETNKGALEMTASPTGALRDNKGKLPLHWVPGLLVLEAIASVLWRNSKPGGGKYPEHNWKKGALHSTPLDSLLRHALKRQAGEMIDLDDGLPHTWKILCNAMFLLFYEKHYPEMNDLVTKGIGVANGTVNKGDSK